LAKQTRAVYGWLPLLKNQFLEHWLLEKIRQLLKARGMAATVSIKHSVHDESLSIDFTDDTAGEGDMHLFQQKESNKLDN
jgi:hypothetical protein